MVSDQIIRHLETKLCSEPPRPFLLAGEIIKDLNLTKSEFYLSAGLILGYRIGEHVEGRKRYFYLIEMVNDYRDKIQGDIK